MKMTKKVSKTLIISAAAALAFGGVAVGTTYALFTSQAGAEVTVASGKVSLKSEIKDLKLYSLNETSGEVEEVEGTAFTNGGSAKINEGTTTVALDKITPGDKVEFTIVVTNESNVDIKYHKFFQTLNDTGLCDGLDIKIDGEAYDGSTLNGEYENWLQSDENKTKEIKVSIELPVDKGNAYQEKKCDLSFKYEAIQKNAKVEAVDDTTFAIYTPTDLAVFAKKGNTNTYNYEKTMLMNDIDMAGLDYMSPAFGKVANLEFDGNGKTIKNLAAVVNSDGSNLNAGFIGHAALKTKIYNVTFDNIKIEGTTVIEDPVINAGAIIGYTDNGKQSIAIDNVTIKNSSVSKVKYAAGIIGYTSTTDNVNISNITLNDVSLSGYTVGGIIGQVGGGSVVINGVKGSNVKVYGYKREGGMVGAMTGTALTIKYNEADYSSTISGNAIADKGEIVGLKGNTTVNGKTL